MVELETLTSCLQELFLQCELAAGLGIQQLEPPAGYSQTSSLGFFWACLQTVHICGVRFILSETTDTCTTAAQIPEVPGAAGEQSLLAEAANPW